MQNQTAGAIPQAPQLEIIDKELSSVVSNIEINLNVISERMNKIHFLPKYPGEAEAKKDSAPDDSSFTFRVHNQIARLNQLEKKTIKILEHFDKMIG